MSLSWTRERSPIWDADKIRIVGEAKAGIFDTRYGELAEGAPVPGEWWRVERDGQAVGYGWLEVVWGDAEILLATAADARGQGVGAFALENLEREAKQRGLNYLYNVVRPTHPEAEGVTAWLTKRGFKATEDGRLLRATPR
jgi:N-acetylglutamate synthase-like GNAT family acetyltransferase